MPTYMTLCRDAPLPPAFQDDGLSPPPAGAVPFHSYWLLGVAALLWRVRKDYKGIKLQKSSDERI